MQVKALKNQIYKLEIYNAGETFEMDDVTAMVKEKQGSVEILGKAPAPVQTSPADEPPLEMNFTGGLPTLDEETSRRKKK